MNEKILKCPHCKYQSKDHVPNGNTRICLGSAMTDRFSLDYYNSFVKIDFLICTECKEESLYLNEEERRNYYQFDEVRLGRI